MRQKTNNQVGDKCRRFVEVLRTRIAFAENSVAAFPRRAQNTTYWRHY